AKNEQFSALAFAEMDYLISLGSFPNYEITVWSWRNGDKTHVTKTGMRGTHHIFR
ncbi:hypothetical protein L9F63_028278, partial [Diploptera punctata]